MSSRAGRVWKWRAVWNIAGRGRCKVCGRGRRDGEGRLKWGSMRPERGDEAARRGTKKPDRGEQVGLGGGLDAEVT